MFIWLFMGLFNILKQRQRLDISQFLWGNGLVSSGALYRLVSHCSLTARPRPAIEHIYLKKKTCIPYYSASMTHYSSSGLADLRHKDKHGHCSVDQEQGV